MARHVRFDETDPSPGAARWVERVWSVGWDLPDGVEHVNSIVPHPSVSLTVERGDVERDGAHGPGRVGHRSRHPPFRRGMPRARGRRGRQVPRGRVHGADGRARRSTSPTAAGPPRGWWPVPATLSELPLDARRSRPGPVRVRRGRSVRHAAADAATTLVTQAVRHLQDPSVTRVDDLADRCGLSVRGLQRLLRQYVGVGPKWMVARRRLHDAVAALDDGYDGSLADLAAHAGWYDQNQFARDFAALVGVTPGAYRDRSTLELIRDHAAYGILGPCGSRWSSTDVTCPCWCRSGRRHSGYDAVFSLPEFEVLRPREGEPPGPVFILQRVPEEKAGKNRMHVDVHPPLELGVPGAGRTAGGAGRQADRRAGDRPAGGDRQLVAGDGRPRGQRVLRRRRPGPPRTLNYSRTST